MWKGRSVAVGAMLVAFFVSASALVRADALDQVPSDALVVIKVKDLDGVSGKIAGWAKTIGIDQQDPAWADPLGTIGDKAHLTKGVKRNGDMAVAIMDPGEAGMDENPTVIAVLPVTNYKTFLTNFKATADEGGEITKATPHEGGKDVYVVNWGQYAAISPVKALVSKKPAGMKITGFSAKESESKDILLYANIKVIRAKVLPELEKGRKSAIDSIENALGGQDGAKPYIPLAKAALGQLINVAEETLKDAHGATVGLAITNAGLSATLAADFEPTSYIGKLALASKNTSESLLNGLPDRKYFFFGGGKADPAVMKPLIADLLDPIIKEMNAAPNLKKFAEAMETAKGSYGVMNGYTMGLVAPTGALGEESVLQEVGIIRGDSKTMLTSQRKILAATNDLMQLLPQQGGVKTSFEIKPGAKTIGDVKFDQFETKINFPEDDAGAQQAKQMLTFVYGPGGMSGVMGAIDDKTVVTVQGGSDELIADTVKAAKANADTLGAMAGVRAVAAELPKERTSVMYVDVGTIISTALRYAKGFGAVPVNVKLPADLPPVGISGGSDGTAFRVDIHVPNKLVQSIVSASAEAQRQMRNPNGGLQ